MTKELYNELLDKRLITDNAITLDYINEHKLELKDIITVPACLDEYLKGYVAPEITVEEVVVVNEKDIIEVTEVDETPELEPVVDTVVIEEEETTITDEILVDETEVEE